MINLKSTRENDIENHNLSNLLREEFAINLKPVQQLLEWISDYDHGFTFFDKPSRNFERRSISRRDGWKSSFSAKKTWTDVVSRPRAIFSPWQKGKNGVVEARWLCIVVWWPRQRNRFQGFLWEGERPSSLRLTERFPPPLLSLSLFVSLFHALPSSQSRVDWWNFPFPFPTCSSKRWKHLSQIIEHGVVSDLAEPLSENNRRILRLLERWMRYFWLIIRIFLVSESFTSDNEDCTCIR